MMAVRIVTQAQKPPVIPDTQTLLKNKRDFIHILDKGKVTSCILSPHPEEVPSHDNLLLM
jgi:hypothetical protein